MGDNANSNSSKNDLSHAKAGRDIKVDQRQRIQTSTNEVVYKGDRSDNSIIEFLCKNVLERLGVKKTIISGAIFSLVGVFGFLTSINSIFVNSGSTKLFSYLPRLPLPSTMASDALAVFIVLAVIGITLLGLYEYRKTTTCPKCGRFYALKEYQDPIVKEVGVRDGTRVYTTRYYKCSSCGKEVTRESQELIEKG